MSPAQYSAGRPESLTVGRPEGRDRRASKRFPLQLPVRYRLLGSKTPALWISAESVNISSTGLLFHSVEEIALGQGIEAFVAWPAALDNRVPLKLAVKGPVVRCEGNQAAIRFERYEFKTRSSEVAFV
jgi:hypothetical protein